MFGAVPRQGVFAAIVVNGAGFDDANGVYIPTGKVWHEAPVYENDQKCLLSREPHKNQKTGETSYGWILGQDRKPLYAVQTDELAPPASGWRKFSGVLPVPRVQGADTIPEAVHQAAQAWKEQGNALFGARRYAEADAKWTRALQFADQLTDELLQVALYSNRAEARLRQQKWEAALVDAQAALQRRPTHDKALLRAAVAAREMKQYDLAEDLVQRCLDAHPKQPEARQLLLDLEELVEQERKDYPDRARAARQKLHESITREDVNSKRSLKAFEGYSNRRTGTEEKPPLSSLPYHNMGLPKDQVDLMDKFFQEMREKKAEKERREREERETYQRVKAEYRERAQEDMAMGKLEPLDQILPSEKAKRQLEGPQELTQVQAPRAKALQTRQQVERVQLSQQDMDEMDALFAPYAGTQAAGPSSGSSQLATTQAGDRKDRLDKAKAMVRVRDRPPEASDKRTAWDRELDREEEEEKKTAEQRARAELEVLRTTRHGEPTRFEQAASEVYCLWKLPAQVSGKEVKVSASQGGQMLTVTVRGVVIFDRKLFHTIRADDIIWSLDDGELHVTLTKGEKNKLWEQLGEVSEIRKDAAGRVVPDSVPEPMSSADRLDKFRQMVTGDDGNQVGYEDLDAEGRRLVDTIRRFEHARATGDNEALSLAEMDLEEFGRLVI